eukprot:6199171-Pleurochrysis_carterae.AAC.2
MKFTTSTVENELKTTACGIYIPVVRAHRCRCARVYTCTCVGVRPLVPARALACALRRECLRSCVRVPSHVRIHAHACALACVRLCESSRAREGSNSKAHLVRQEGTVDAVWRFGLSERHKTRRNVRLESSGRPLAVKHLQVTDEAHTGCQDTEGKGRVARELKIVMSTFPQAQQREVFQSEAKRPEEKL